MYGILNGLWDADRSLNPWDMFDYQYFIVQEVFVREFSLLRVFES